MSEKMKALFMAAILLLSLLAVGCGTPSSPPVDGSQQQVQPGTVTADTMRLTVYYATADAMYLTPEVRVVPKSDHPAAAAVELLFQEPLNRELLRVFPKDAKLKNLSVKGHTAYADFNDKLRNSQGSATEILIVDSIVNTLTEFPDIQKVQILVEGKRVATLSGHMDVSQPLSRAEEIIKKPGTQK